MFGIRLAEIRREHEDTQQQLADKLGVSKFTVSSWEQEKASPGLDTFKKICEIYDISSDFLLGLIDYDPGWEVNRTHYRYSEEDLALLNTFREFLEHRRSLK